MNISPKSSFPLNKPIEWFFFYLHFRGIFQHLLFTVLAVFANKKVKITNLLFLGPHLPTFFFWIRLNSIPIRQSEKIGLQLRDSIYKSVTNSLKLRGKAFAASVSAPIIGGGLFARIDITMHVFVEFDQLVEVFRYLLQKFLVFAYYWQIAALFNLHSNY